MALIFLQEWRASSSSYRLPVLIGIFPVEKLLLAQGHVPFSGRETLTKDQKVWSIYKGLSPIDNPVQLWVSHWLRLLLGMHCAELPALSSLASAFPKVLTNENSSTKLLTGQFYLRIYLRKLTYNREIALSGSLERGSKQILAHKNNVVHCLFL